MERLRPSPALVIAILALVIALSGTAYAAVKSNGDAIIKKQSLSGNRLKADTVTGTKINESSLGTVPNATNATNATNADTATSANSAQIAASVPAPSLSPYSFGPGWALDTNAGSREGGYRKDISGFVHLQGLVSRTSGTGLILLTLPPGYRPTTNTYFPVFTTGGTFGSIFINSDGLITLNSGDPAYVSLEGVTFYPDR